MKTILTVLFFGLALVSLSSQIIINEIDISGDRVELYNAGTTTIDISNYTLCNRPRYRVVSRTTDLNANAGVLLISGSYVMAPGDFTVLDWANISEYGPTDGELGLYEMFGSFGDPNNIMDYVQWGTGPTNAGRDDTAVTAGIWDSNTSFVPAPNDANNTIGLAPGNYNSGMDTESMDWEEQTPTFGAANASIMADCPTDQDISGIISQDTYYASNNIMSNGTVAMSDTVLFVAGNEIMLNGGFTVELSALFEASIGACP